MKSFALLWQSLLDSTLWIRGTKEMKIVWITLLALKDKNGNVHCSDVGLAHKAIVSIDECRAALTALGEPDADSGNRECEGRRIVPIDGGWHIVSHEKYRYGSDAARAYWREAKQIQRRKRNGPQAREQAYTKAVKTEDQKTAKRLLDGVND